MDPGEALDRLMLCAVEDEGSREETAGWSWNRIGQVFSSVRRAKSRYPAVQMENPNPCTQPPHNQLT